MTRDNERLEIPNSVIAKEALINYATGSVCDEISIGISYNEPPNRVREVMLKVMRDVPQVLLEPSPEVLAWEYGDSAIKYRIKYWIARLRLAGAHARTRRVQPLVRAAAPCDGDSVPDPDRRCARRRPRRRREGRRGVRKRDDPELRQIDFLRGLSDEEMRLLVPNVAVHEFGAGEMLFSQGERATRCSSCAAARSKSSGTPTTA